MLTNLEELAQMLQQMQQRREVYFKCELSPLLSDRVSDAELVEALITGLPMAQGISHRILRSRGRGVILTVKVRYRDAVRLLAGDPLMDQTVLTQARLLADEAAILPEAERFQHIYDWVSRNIRYVHTAPGQKGYDRLVGAAGVLQDRQANCQGFADVMYLLCGLCGIPCEYRIGNGVRRLHVWNVVCIGGEWRDVDASTAARGLIS